MKGVLLAAVFAAGIGVALTPVVSTIYADAYPQDPMKREALAQCSRADREFNRLLADERAACYRRFLPEPPPALPVAQAEEPHVAANFVDLWQAQARGHQPAGDVRTQQRNGDALRLIRASRP